MRLGLQLLLVGSLFYAAGCFSCEPPKLECELSSQCVSGSVCIDYHCHVLCRVQQDCTTGMVCSKNGMCVEPAPGTVPDVTTVNGNAPDPAHITDGLVVTGTALADAAFEARGESGAIGLDARTRTDTRVELVLPADIRSGNYMLVATNQSGVDQAPVQLVLPELTGDQLVERLNTATTTLVLGVMPNEVAGLVSAVSSLQAQLAALSDCPAGYARDGSRTDIVLCKRGADEMVRVGDHWVDRYEASVWQSADCTGTQYGAPWDDYPATFPDNGNVTSAANKLYACSAAGVTPSARLTWFQAQQACLASGKHLITNDEWQGATAGTYDPGANDGLANPHCNTSSAGLRATGNAGNSPGATCVSIHGVEDMIGNVDEFVATWAVESGATGTLTWADTSQANYGSDAYSHGGAASNIGPNLDNSNTVYSETSYATTIRVPAATTRGGHFYGGALSGSFALSSAQAPTIWYSAIGFRCARAR